MEGNRHFKQGGIIVAIQLYTWKSVPLGTPRENCGSMDAPISLWLQLHALYTKFIIKIVDRVSWVGNDKLFIQLQLMTTCTARFAVESYMSWLRNRFQATRNYIRLSHFCCQYHWVSRACTQFGSNEWATLDAMRHGSFKKLRLARVERIKRTVFITSSSNIKNMQYTNYFV